MNQIINLFLGITTIVMNGVVGFSPINQKYDIDVTPADGTFGIWTIIYTLLVFSLAQVKGEWSNIATFYFLISCIANVSWLYLWGKQQIEYANISLIVLPISLILLWNNNRYNSNEIKNDYLMQNTIALYAGWTIGACLINSFITIKKNKLMLNGTINKTAIAFFCLSQIVWQVYGIIDGGSDFFKSSVAIPLVGIWTSLGIINNLSGSLKKLSYIYLASSSISLLHHLYRLS